MRRQPKISKPWGKYPTHKLETKIETKKKKTIYFLKREKMEKKERNLQEISVMILFRKMTYA